MPYPTDQELDELRERLSGVGQEYRGTPADPDFIGHWTAATMWVLERFTTSPDKAPHDFTSLRGDPRREVRSLVNRCLHIVSTNGHADPRRLHWFGEPPPDLDALWQWIAIQACYLARLLAVQQRADGLWLQAACAIVNPERTCPLCDLATSCIDQAVTVAAGINGVVVQACTVAGMKLRAGKATISRSAVIPAADGSSTATDLAVFGLLWLDQATTETSPEAAFRLLCAAADVIAQAERDSVLGMVKTIPEHERSKAEAVRAEAEAAKKRTRDNGKKGGKAHWGQLEPIRARVRAEWSSGHHKTRNACVRAMIGWVREETRGKPHQVLSETAVRRWLEGTPEPQKPPK